MGLLRGRFRSRSESIFVPAAFGIGGGLVEMAYQGASG